MFFQEQYVIPLVRHTTSVHTYLFHNLQLIFLTANAMHPSANGLSPLLGIYRSRSKFHP